MHSVAAVFTDLQIKIRSFELIIAYFRSAESEGERSAPAKKLKLILQLGDTFLIRGSQWELGCNP